MVAQHIVMEALKHHQLNIVNRFNTHHQILIKKVVIMKRCGWYAVYVQHQ